MLTKSKVFRKMTTGGDDDATRRYLLPASPPNHGALDPAFGTAPSLFAAMLGRSRRSDVSTTKTFIDDIVENARHEGLADDCLVVKIAGGPVTGHEQDRQINLL